MNTNDSLMNRRILVIDDNPSIHEDFRKLLAPAENKSAGLQSEAAALFGEAPIEAAAALAFEMHSALQGQEALKMVEDALENHTPYALAFVDMRMPPGWDGLETIQRLWRSDPKLQIVICTAYSDHGWDEIQGALRCNDRWLVLKKPFDKIEVIQLASSLTEKWNLELLAAAKHEALESLVRARTQDLENSFRTRSEFLANASHELLTPMNGICGMLEFLADSPLDEQQKEYLKDARESADSLALLLKRVLDFNRAEAGALRADANEFYPADLVLQIADGVELPARAKGLSVKTDTAAVDGRMWMGPAAFIKKTFDLLIENAIKFTPLGSVTLIAREAASGLEFEVADTGIGLNEEQLRLVNIPFAQVDGTMSRRSSGIGLGLPLARRLVRAMGGELHLSSAPERGLRAVFTVAATRLKNA